MELMKWLRALRSTHLHSSPQMSPLFSQQNSRKTLLLSHITFVNVVTIIKVNFRRIQQEFHK